MPCIKYPFHVKHAGREYAPGEAIRVKDAAPYLARGAVLVPENETPQPKPARKKPAKAKPEE